MNSLTFSHGFTNVSLEIISFQEGEYFVAYSPAMDLTGQGKDKHEAIDSLVKIIRITINWASKEGTLQKYLLEKGWTLREHPKAVYSPPQFNAEEIKKHFNIKQFETKKVPVYA
jgi:hypothetical protein